MGRPDPNFAWRWLAMTTRLDDEPQVGYLRPCVGWNGFHPSEPCSLLNDCHTRPVNVDRFRLEAKK
jgi:hypothetical protein